MAYDIYSERVKQAKQEVDPYRYDEIPEGLRSQIFHTLKSLMEDISSYGIGNWEEFWSDFCKEKGLPWHRGNDFGCRSAFHNYLMKEQNGVEDILDSIDIAFQFAVKEIRQIPNQRLSAQARKAYIRTIYDLNTYFKRTPVGYKIEANKIIRIDSEYLHSEAIIPALVFLRKKKFDVANKKFLEAHEHYRNNRYQDCITCSNAAFESVMKIICDQMGWIYGRGTANDLVRTLLGNGFIPSYLQRHFQQLIFTLSSGLPPVRHNQGSAHGQGEKATEVPAYMAGYALHLAATNILFLAQADEASRG